MNGRALEAKDAAALQVLVRGVSPTCGDRPTCCKINRLRDTRKLKCIDNIKVVLQAVQLCKGGRYNL